MKKDKRLKIAVFHLAFFYSGGGEKLVLEEVRALRKKGYEVDCFSPVVEKCQCFPDIIEEFNLKQLFPRLPRFIRHQETLEIVFTCLFFPLIAAKFRKYDVVFAANQPAPWLAWIVKKFYGVPYLIYLAQPTRILHPREIDNKEGLWLKEEAIFFPLMVKLAKPLIDWADHVSIKGARAMLVNGTYMAKILKKIYSRLPVVCPAGAHPAKKILENRWQGAVQANGFKIEKPYILLTNRHFPHKKFEYAIETMPEIIRTVPGAKLIVTGNPTEYTRKLRERVKELSLEGRVVFTGFVSENGLKDLYANAAVYVYTSPEEDFGMGVIEAMAAGIPPVAWKKGGPATTVIDGVTGYLVKPYLQDDFRQKIVKLLKERKKSRLMGREAYKHVKNNFSYEKHNLLLEKEILRAAKKQ